MQNAQEEQPTVNLLTNIDSPDDLKKLSPEQVTKILDMVTRKKPEFVACMYHFPAMGLQSFYYMAK